MLGDNGIIAVSPDAELKAELTAELAKEELELDAIELLDELEIDEGELVSEELELATDELELATDDDEDCDELLAPLYSMGNRGLPWSEFFCVNIQV